jgi:hypothetical protein
MSHGAVGVRAPVCGSRRQLLQHPRDLRNRRRSKRGSSKHGGNENDVPKIKSRRFGEIWQTGGGIPKRTASASLLWCQSLRLRYHSRHRTNLNSVLYPQARAGRLEIPSCAKGSSSRTKRILLGLRDHVSFLQLGSVKTEAMMSIV